MRLVFVLAALAAMVSMAMLATIGSAATGAAPTATTTAANGITVNAMGGSATLNGTVVPNGAATTYHFEYGPSTAYGSVTPTGNLPGDNVSHPVSATVTGLANNTRYHFRLVATNSFGTSMGQDMTFITLNCPAGTTDPNYCTSGNGGGGTGTGGGGVGTSGNGTMTLPATVITATSARLNGIVDNQGVSTSYTFQYGPTTSYGLTTPLASARRAASLRATATVSPTSPRSRPKRSTTSAS